MRCGKEEAPSKGFSGFCLRGEHHLCRASKCVCACPKHRREHRQPEPRLDKVDIAERERINRILTAKQQRFMARLQEMLDSDQPK